MSVGSCVFTSNIYTYDVSSKGTYYSDIMIGWGATQTSAMEGVKTIAGYVFGRTALNMGTTTKTLPDSVEYISPYAFYGQTAFKLSATLPKLKSVGSHAFYGCDKTGVINIDAPECLYLGSYAFYRTSTTYAGPSRINTPKASYVGNSCFYSGRSAPINLTLSSVAYIGSSAFYYCSNMIMTNAILSLTNSVIAASTFYSCSKLSTVMSLQGSVYASAFALCSAISTVIMNASTTKTISTFAFVGCRSLMSLYLLGSVVTLAATAAFQSTPLSLSTYTGSFGSIFVPESLYSSYLTRTYWSAYSSRFVSMTDTEIQEVLDYWNGVINS